MRINIKVTPNSSKQALEFESPDSINVKVCV